MIDFKKFKRTEQPSFIAIPSELAVCLKHFLDRDRIPYKIHKELWKNENCPVSDEEAERRTLEYFGDGWLADILEINISEEDALSEIDKIYFFDKRDPEVTEYAEKQKMTETVEKEAERLGCEPSAVMDTMIAAIAPTFIENKFYSHDVTKKQMIPGSDTARLKKA